MGAVPKQGQRALSTSCEAEMSAVHADDLAACQLLDVLRHNLRVSEAGPAVGSRLDHELLPSAPLRRSEELAARDAVVERHERARDAAAVLVALERRTWICVWTWSSLALRILTGGWLVGQSSKTTAALTVVG